MESNGSKGPASGKGRGVVRRVAASGIVILGLILLFLLRDMIWSMSLSHSVADYRSEHLIHSKEHAMFNDNKTAFVFGAVGPYSSAELFKCMSAVESLVKIGGWLGDVYLLIDDTTCLDPRLFNSLPNKNIHVIPFLDNMRRRLRTDGQSLDSHDHHSSNHSHREHTNTTTHRRLFNTQPFERSMAIKTHILDYLQPHVEVALWYDCDVIFAKPGCVKTMLSKPIPITAEKPIAIPFPYHVGSFAVKRNVSGPALLAWREKILGQNSGSALGKKDSIPDYLTFKELFGGVGDAYTSVSDKHHKNHSSKPWTIHDPFIVGEETGAHYALTPREYHDIIVPDHARNYSAVAESTHCVIHLTNGRCRHLTPQGLQHLVQSFHLQSLHGRQWCPSVMRRKFKTYGLKWPFCWTPSFF